ncbi:MAG: hypothetical protein OJF49_003643 [Ktedonobacterales bacterium]|nr:MAG: hypothetical protein OJF49_003643 [Ktedonobacterales bacterium]
MGVRESWQVLDKRWRLVVSGLLPDYIACGCRSSRLGRLVSAAKEPAAVDVEYLAR